MVIFLFPQLSSQAKGIKEAFTDSAPPLLSSRLRQAKERGAYVVIKTWPSQDNVMCPSTQKPPPLWRHSRSCSSSRWHFHPNGVDALSHPGASPFGDISSAQDWKQQAISGLCHQTTTADHPWSLLPSTTTATDHPVIHAYSYAIQSSPACITCQCLPIWTVMDKTKFFACNPNNLMSVITTATANQHM